MRARVGTAMTAPPPDRPGEGDRPAGDRDVEASFAAIVSGWDGPAPRWPETPTEPPPSAVREPDRAGRGAAAPEDDTSANNTADDNTADDDTADEGHYEPPEPPPVPRLAQATLGALGIIALAALLLMSPGTLGLSSGVGFPLGLIALSGGLGWLLLRLRSGAGPDSGWDDGAQL